LQRLKLLMPPEAVTGANEDAFVIQPVVNELQVQTMDGLGAIFDDPYLLGKVVAEHSLNSVYAMGGVPRTALTWAVVPHGADAVVEEELFQLMSGAVRAFDVSGVSLIGGHSEEGGELSAGFAVTGTVDERDVWRKHKLAGGDWLILTKPVGAGVLLTAHRHARCRAERLFGALDNMLQSNRLALSILRKAGVKACAGVRESGVLGHLGEMARGAKMSVEVWPHAVPSLSGAKQAMVAGFGNAPEAAGENTLEDVDSGEFRPGDTHLRILFEPEVSGGLLAAARPDAAEQCLADLRAAGYSSAAVIGRVGEPRDDGRWGALLQND
jgi:selenide,water dikinase